jgi:protein TonB
MFAQEQIQSFPVASEVPEENKHRPWRTALLIGFFCVAVLGGSFVVGRDIKTRNHWARPSAFELTPRFDGANVEIAWPPDAAEIRAAQRGLLVIVDGATANRVELSPADLGTGRYQYSPHSGNLSFVLTVYRENNSFAGATADLNSAAAEPGDGSELDAPPAVSAAAPNPGKQASEPPEDTIASVSQPAEVPLRQFVVPPKLTRPVSTPQVTPPPDLANSSGGAQVKLPLQSAAIPPPAAPRPAPVVVPPQVNIASAVPIKRVTPRPPTYASGGVHDSVSIHVRVSIDAQGKVVSANPMEPVNGFDRRVLANSAVEAAKEWRFEPARRNGVPVASDTVLEFHFIRQ